MAVDVRSHYLRYPGHFSRVFILESSRSRNREIGLTVRWDECQATARASGSTIGFVDKAPPACTLTRLLDEVAIRHPGVKIILAHPGHPYDGHPLVSIREYANLDADCSALHYRPFQFDQSLMLVQECGIWNKLLFRSDYPFTTADASLAGMRTLIQMLERTALSRQDTDAMEDMFERDTLRTLEIEV